ncbi:hypothetical protein PR202_gb13594 [Eleusine coracana subsp. coracana]|uniref:F-box domain-containing protein n=1 Tax=Eleusine coracana subsp. coracana TaxID=191504 RepID=A0AAV5ET90_ELECO|nr:hypothetical protein QOZ80_9BG0717220 [Eleusine coracana subsp. coracana]GJN25729.1 hypothetical protein PR202_gb13594 [Eleusine coracana subsp. coracana]
MDIDTVAGGGDRLSRLSDGVLGHILSFLPAPEAARAAALSRRWRHVFSAVHTLSFDESDGRPNHQDDDDDVDVSSAWSSDCYNHSPTRPPRSVPAPPFATGVLAALLGRHRGAARARAPLHALRVRFDYFSEAASATAMDALVSYAVLDAGGELRHVDLRFGGGPICNREYSLGQHEPASPPSTNDYAVPTSLFFSCTALRTLRLGPCKLNLPSTITLPSLDMMHLVRVTDTRSSTNIQRLVSSCPRLADLSLEACLELTELSVLGTRLRSLTLKCCHDLTSVAIIDSSQLEKFKYRGVMPPPPFLTLHGAHRISWCALDFCGDEASNPAQLVGLAALLQLFASTKYLRLKSARLGCSIGHGIFSSLRGGFPVLSHIEITGMVPDGDTAVIATMRRILEWSPSLEIVSLFFLPELEEIDENNYRYYNEDEVHDAHKLSYRYVDLPVPEGAMIRCLRERAREINFVHYQGAMAQRMVAKFLLRNAPVVDEVCCEFATGPLIIQNKLMEEIKGWTMNKSANMMFF